MENIDTYLRKILAAGVGAADIGYEKLGAFVDECIKRGEVTVEKGRALNEELKHRCKDAMSSDSERKASIDLEKLSDSERAELLEKLLAMKENNK